MKVAIVTPYAEPERGAATIRVNAFRDYFKEKGCKVKIFAPKREGIEESEGVYRYGSIFNLMKSILANNFDVVIGTSPPLTHNFFALIACRLSRKKFVLDAKEDPLAFEPLPSFFSAKGIKRRLYFLLRAFTYKHADMLFFLTEWDKKLEIKRYGLNPEKCILVPNGSDPNIIYYSEEARKETRKELNIPANATVLIYAGGIGDEEIHELVDAFDKLDKEDVFLLLVVSIEKANELQLKEILEKARSCERIRIVKNVAFEEMYRYLSAADIGLVPWPEKYYTSLPVKVFDYLAAGLPIVVKGPKKGALKDFYEKHHIVGFYVCDWKNFQDTLKNTITNLNEIKRLNAERIKLIKIKYCRQLFLRKAFERLKSL